MSPGRVSISSPRVLKRPPLRAVSPARRNRFRSDSESLFSANTAVPFFSSLLLLLLILLILLLPAPPASPTASFSIKPCAHCPMCTEWPEHVTCKFRKPPYHALSIMPSWPPPSSHHLCLWTVGGRFLLWPCRHLTLNTKKCNAQHNTRQVHAPGVSNAHLPSSLSSTHNSSLDPIQGRNPTSAKNTTFTQAPS